MTFATLQYATFVAAAIAAAPVIVQSYTAAARILWRALRQQVEGYCPHCPGTEICDACTEHWTFG